MEERTESPSRVRSLGGTRSYSLGVSRAGVSVEVSDYHAGTLVLTRADLEELLRELHKERRKWKRFAGLLARWRKKRDPAHPG